jgi:voltage-gated potassium channel
MDTIAKTSDAVSGRSRNLLRALSGIVLVLIIGTLGYRIIEGWSYLDAFYMAVTTLTTVGFGEVHPLSESGRVFTLLIIFVGFGLAAYTALTGSQILIEGEVEKIFTRRRSMKYIEKIRNHFIVCGFGRMGSFICHELKARGIPFVVVERNTEVQDKIVRSGYFLSPGDASDEEILLGANIRTARGLVSVLDSDVANVYVVLTARELNPRLLIVARAGEEEAEKKLRRAGASRVISPYRIGGMRLVMGILKPTVMSFLEVAMDHSQMNIELEEVPVAKDSSYSGKKLIETDIRKDLDLIIIAIKKKGGEMVFNPGPNTMIHDEDTLIAMGHTKDLAVLKRKTAWNSIE